MDEKWEKIGRETRSRWNHRHVSLNPNGSLVMNAVVYVELGSPAEVDLFYNWAEKTIGVLPAPEATRDSYPVGSRGKSAKVVRALRLLQRCRIDMPHSLRFTAPEIDKDGMLKLDLRRTAPLQPSLAG